MLYCYRHLKCNYFQLHTATSTFVHLFKNQNHLCESHCYKYTFEIYVFMEAFNWHRPTCNV